MNIIGITRFPVISRLFTILMIFGKRIEIVNDGDGYTQKEVANIL